MPLDLEMLKKALEGSAELEAIIENVTESIEEEKTKSIEIKRKLDKEARSLRQYKIDLEKLGYSTEAGTVEEWVSSLKKDPNTPNSEVTELQKQIKLLTDKMAEKETEAANLKAEQRTGTLTNKLTELLGDKVFGAKYVVKNLIADGKVDLLETGDVAWVEGESVLPIEKGIKDFLAANTDILKTNQRPGGGTPPRQDGAHRYSEADIDKMSVEEIIANKQAVLDSLRSSGQN